MLESDWKKIRDMVPKLRERYLTEQNTRLGRLLSDPKKNETERFWDTFEAIKKQARILKDCLDGHSRSRMWLYMLTMLQVGMLKKDDLAVFSEELRNELLEASSARNE